MIDVASSREEFVARAVNHTVVPVRTALVSDDDTPVGGNDLFRRQNSTAWSHRGA